MRYLLIAFLVLVTFASTAVAQDGGDGTRIPVMSAPEFITVPDGEPLVLWVRSVDEDLAQAVVLVEAEDGTYQQLTPCDNVEVVCQDVEIPAQGTQPGDTFYLASE
jgi:hypothetical protein